MLLSPRVKELPHEPICYNISRLYFRAESSIQSNADRITFRYFSVRGSRRRLTWWMNYLLHRLSVVSVEVLYPTARR